MTSEPLDLAGQISTLEAFVADKPDLGELERLSREFDALGFLGLSGKEETHSNVLAWLLRPHENHGAGDYFLKNFLVATGAATSQEVESGDWSETTVRREWPNVVDGKPGRLDILILNQKERFACAIENKISSPEDFGQLTRYRKALEERYPNLCRRYLFLSPGGTLPRRCEDRKSWTPADYGKVLDAVEATLREGMDQEGHASAFLRQYITTLRRNIVPDTTVEQLATRIYLRHREAIDLIIRHRDAYIKDLEQFCREAIRQQEGWDLDRSPEKLVGFLHNDWKLFKSFHTGTGWNPQSDAALLFDFDLREPGRVHLILTIASGDCDKVRKPLFDMAQQRCEMFDARGHRLRGEYNNNWIRLYVSEPILSEEDFIDWDRSAARQGIMDWVSRFAAHEFPAMNAAIITCLQETDKNLG